MSNPSPSVQAITEFYGAEKAERTGIPYINHVHEGMKILELLNVDQRVVDAFALHPIFQGSDAPDEEAVMLKYGSSIDEHTIFLAHEYRKTANSYLCKPHYRSKDDIITLSEHDEVNLMLIADKIQNRKDFEAHYETQTDKDVFARSENLAQYFRNWLRVLGVSEVEYQDMLVQLG